MKYESNINVKFQVFKPIEDENNYEVTVFETIGETVKKYVHDYQMMKHAECLKMLSVTQLKSIRDTIQEVINIKEQD